MKLEDSNVAAVAALGGGVGGLLLPLGSLGSAVLGAVFGGAIGLAAKSLAPSVVQSLRATRAGWVRGFFGLAILYGLLIVTSVIATGLWAADRYIGLPLNFGHLRVGPSIGVSFAIAIWIVRSSRRPVPPLRPANYAKLDE